MIIVDVFCDINFVNEVLKLSLMQKAKLDFDIKIEISSHSLYYNGFICSVLFLIAQKQLMSASAPPNRMPFCPDILSSTTFLHHPITLLGERKIFVCSTLSKEYNL